MTPIEQRNERLAKTIIKNLQRCHIVVGTIVPEICPTCDHPQAFFEINAENY